MRHFQRFSLLLAIGLLFSSCTVIRQGEVGIKRTLGKVHDQPLMQGAKVYFPFTTTVIRMPVNTRNAEVKMDLPSREGLNIASEISILYNVDPTKSVQLFEEVGLNFEYALIVPVFRSAAADVCARFYAKDMHSGVRAQIESGIKELMMAQLAGRGIQVQAVLMKSIRLPTGLAKAIEDKLQAEQQSQQMEFVIQREKQEAERLKIQAEGIRDAQSIIGEGLTPLIIQFKSIEAFRELSQSPNAKIIITDGKAPLLIQQGP